MPKESLRELLFFTFYTLAVFVVFGFILWLVSYTTDSWMYFNIISEQTGLSVRYLKHAHYALIAIIALLWTYNSYKHTHKKHTLRHEIIDRYTLHILKLLIIPSVALILLIFALVAALVQTYGASLFTVRVAFSNDPTIFEFFSLIESVLLALLAFTAYLYLLKRFIYWIKNG